MPETKRVRPLRTPDDLIDAYEWLFTEQESGKMDGKTADALNTTLKGATYIRGKLRLDAAKIIIQAQIKKITIPPHLLEDIVGQVKPEGLPEKKQVRGEAA